MMNLLKRLFKAKDSRALNVEHVLEQAMNTESPFDVYIGENPGERPDARLSVVAIADEHVILEAIVPPSLPNSWIGRQLTCTVKVELAEAIQPLIYYFTSKILQITEESDDLPQVVIQTPAEISRMEERKNLRVLIPEHRMLSMKCWEAEKPDEKSKAAIDETKPVLLELVPNTNDDVMVHDISVSGVRISLHEQSHSQILEKLQVGKHLLFWIAFPDEGWDTPMECLLSSRVARQNELPLGRLDIGVHFIVTNAQLKKPNEDEWTPFLDGGLEGLTRWVQRRVQELNQTEEREDEEEFDMS